jgi:hypothetical protein
VRKEAGKDFVKNFTSSRQGDAIGVVLAENHSE